MNTITADVLSVNSFDCGRTSVASIKDTNHGDVNLNLDVPHSEVRPVFLDEISSSENIGSGREDGLLENCGILSNNCLPRLTSTVVPVEKRSLSSSPPSSRKKADLKLPFKWKDGNPCATLREYLHLTFDLVALARSSSNVHHIMD